jgi:predicted secreted protein
MMRRHAVLFLALAAAAGIALAWTPALAGSATPGSATTAPAPVGEPSCPAQSDQTVPIMAQPGETFALGLPSNRTTGYLWQLAASPDPSVVQFVANVYVTPAPPSGGAPIVGAAGRECWVFSAVAMGQTTLTLDYLRPFDPPGTPPAQSATFTIIVGG